MSNRIHLAQLGEMTIEEVSALPVDQISALLDDLAEAKDLIKRQDAVLHHAISTRYAARASEMRASRKEMTGTVNITDGEYQVKCDLPKRVEWDQDKLRAALVVLEDEWGEDVREYVDIEIKVPENKFKAWPSKIAALFAPARMVNVGRETFKISYKPATEKRRAA